MSTTSFSSDPTPTPNRLFQPTSPLSEPVWKSVSNERSTFDLVSSCVLTLIMCVWTAIHLNIPKYKERRKKSWWPYIWRRMWWMFLGLIAPELVLYSAWSQFIQARLVCVRLAKLEAESAKKNASASTSTTTSEKTVPASSAVPVDDYETDDENYDDIELARKKTGSSTSSRQSLLPTHHSPSGGEPQSVHGASDDHSYLSRWERLKHAINPGELERGYYAVMGGFEVVIGQEPDPDNPGEIRDIRRTVTPCGTILLARLGLLPPVSVESINDKSKADLLTKGLVCVQGMWMLIQAIGRKVEHLPITLLELNTIMHVVCALIMYILWLKKPQDVGIPHRIADKHTSRPLGALLCIRDVQECQASEIPGGEKQFGGILQYTRNGVYIYKSPGATDYNVIWSVSNPAEMKTLEAEPVKVYGFWIEPSVFLRLGLDTYLTPRSAQFLVDYSTGVLPTFGKKERKGDWNLFVEELKHNGSYGCTKRAGNFNLEGDIKSSGSTYAGWIAAICFPAIYGGIHLTPWRAHFPTHLERYLWRFSGLYVACGVPGLFILYVLMEGMLDTYNPFKGPFRAVKYTWRRLKPESLCVGIIWYPILVLVVLPAVFAVVAGWGIALLGMTVMYPLTRLYILVEAFASLRSLPKGAYTSVGWTEMLPHF